MDFDLTGAQQEIVQGVRALCARFNDDYWRAKDAAHEFPHDFYQAVAKAGYLGVAIPEEFGGSGLGMTIVRNLVQLMGGQVDFTSRESEGTSFHIRLPFGMQPQEAPRSLPSLRAQMLTGDAMAGVLTPLLTRWGIACQHVDDASHLMSGLHDAWSMGHGCHVVLVERAALKMSPELLAQAVRGKKAMAQPDMILIDEEPNRGTDRAMYAKGYTAVLHLPLDESLLFNALHVTSVTQRMSPEVISLADAYRRKRGVHALSILVAEDNAVNQEVIREILERAGHRVTLAEDGEQALDALVDFDLHFVDIVFLGEHGCGEMLIGIEHGVNGLVNSALDKAAHPEQALLQFFEIAFEMAFHGSSFVTDAANRPKSFSLCTTSRTANSAPDPK